MFQEGDFKKELEGLLQRYPKIEEITYTMRQTQVVKRHTQPIMHIDFDDKPKDEGSLMDSEVKAKMERIKNLIPRDEQN